MPSEIPTAHAVRYELLHTDASGGARCGVLSTPHGELPLPTFMPVGTVGTVKGLTIDQVAATGAGIILGNTYHLALRPGAEVVAQLGGLHAFSGWEGPILTDSGGFQIFSLADRVKITEQGATFQSHIDGASLSLTPEESIAIQEQLGSDIAMQLDHVIACRPTAMRLPTRCSAASAGRGGASRRPSVATNRFLPLCKVGWMPSCGKNRPSGSWNSTLPATPSEV